MVCYADCAQISRQSATVSLSGSKMNSLYVDSSYPVTLGQIAQRVAEQAELTIPNTAFRNSGVNVASKTEWAAETNTLRSTIGYIAGCAGGFARIDR